MSADLFGYQPQPSIKYVRGSDTSKAAAESIEPTVSLMQGRVLDIIRLVSPHGGATCDEIEEYSGLRHQTVSARIRELFEAGFITFKSDGPEGKRLTRSGRAARIYIANLRSAS